MSQPKLAAVVATLPPQTTVRQLKPQQPYPSLRPQNIPTDQLTALQYQTFPAALIGLMEFVYFSPQGRILADRKTNHKNIRKRFHFVIHHAFTSGSANG